MQRVLPDYRVPLFKALCRTIPSTRILFGQPRRGESILNFAGVLDEHFVRLRNRYLGRGSAPYVTGFQSALRRNSVVIVNFELGNLNTLLLILLRRLLNLRLVLWTFGYDPAKGFHPNSAFKDRLRLFLYRRADSVVFYWEHGRRTVVPYLRHPEACFVAPNTLDTIALEQIRLTFEGAGRPSVRAAVGMGDEPHFVFVGRLIPDKQVDFLIRAFDIARVRVPNMRLTIVGSGPEERRLREMCEIRKLEQVRFVGRIDDPVAVGRYLYGCDAMTMPGRLGLSVVHAFAFGAPVVSLRKDTDFHGEGIGYLRDNENGLLVQDESEERYADALVSISSDPALRKRLSEAAVGTVRDEASIHVMVNGMVRAITHAAGETS